jgi:hypothetical protein
MGRDWLDNTGETSKDKSLGWIILEKSHRK